MIDVTPPLSPPEHEPRPVPAAAVGPLRELATRSPLPPPGEGGTRQRFDTLAAASLPSLGVGRLFEAHVDGQAILHEAGRGDAEIQSLGLLGVWASDREGGVRVQRQGRSARLFGAKPFCSGAPLLDRALVTAAGDDGIQLCLVDLAEDAVGVEPSTWTGLGMRSTETRTVQFDGVPCELIGAPGWYLGRPGFWHGAVGVAASWFGGALGVLATLRDGVAVSDVHQLGHLGEAEALRYAMEASLWRGAAEIDGQPDDGTAARARALRIRRIVADGCLQLIRHTDDALGPRALAFDDAHSQRVADLEVYVRQEHGRHDSEQIGRSALEGDRSC